MYYQNYEDYMRQVLGYPINDPNIYESYDYRNNQTYEDTYSSRNQVVSNLSEEEIRDCYPEIYNLVYPMVCKVCDTNTQPITRELIEKMTDEVYLAIEDTSTVVNIRVDTPKTEENRTTNNSSHMQRSEIKNEKTSTKEESQNSRTNSNRTVRVEDSRMPKFREDRLTKNVITDTSKSSMSENRQVVNQPIETRQTNTSLRDLIKILILLRLFGNRPNRPRPPRPPFPGGPGRPPFPGGRPPMGPGRPPMQPREYPNYLEY